MSHLSTEQNFLYRIPRLNTSALNNNIVIKELKNYHQLFYNNFKRSESREHFFQYMINKFVNFNKKNKVNNVNTHKNNIRSMQRFISETQWHDKEILSTFHSLVAYDLGRKDAALILEERGFEKKGYDSIGAERQSCSNHNNEINCQVGVFVTYASQDGYSIVDKRLFIPKQWFNYDSTVRLKKCNAPEGLKFKTKSQLAAEMLRHIADEGTLPFKYILGDELSEENSHFIKIAHELNGPTYFISIPGKTKCWLETPVTLEKKYRYAGEQKRKTVLLNTKKKPIPLSTLAEGTNSYFWYQRKVYEGINGVTDYEFSRRRVRLSLNGLPQHEVWAIIRRSMGNTPEYKYYISNASPDAGLAFFVWLSGLRWASEQCMKETKSELGIDQYEVRQFPGWHHHIMTCMLGHFFLWHLKIKLGIKSTDYYRMLF
jgi:SRSO17 transposase